jgi:hypothetical protein
VFFVVLASRENKSQGDQDDDGQLALLHGAPNHERRLEMAAATIRHRSGVAKCRP